MKIFIIGYMGSGKSTIGKKLAHSIQNAFIDLDKMIEECSHFTISDIFKKFDEEAFRKIEQNTLHQLEKMKNLVVATGGGTPTYDDNMKWIKENGLSIYLKLSPKSLQTRLLSSKKKRPLIQEKSETELLEYIEQHLTEREKFYNQADIIIRGENLTVPILKGVIKAKLRKQGLPTFRF